QVYERVYTFGPNAPARGAGLNGLVQGNDGNFYGTTELGGALGNGTVFKVTPNGVPSTLVDFANTSTGNSRGSSPQGGLVQGNDGNFYGTTSSGGASNSGTVFEVTIDGAVSTLVDFTDTTTGNSRGGHPEAELV